MLTIRIENKLNLFILKFCSKIRSFVLFGNSSQVRFGKRVRLSGSILLGMNVSIRDYTDIRGSNITIENDVVIHENVLIRSNDFIKIGKGTTINRNCSILAKVEIGRKCSIAPNVVIIGSGHLYMDKNIYIKDQGVELKGIVIKDDVWIAANSSVLDGVTIGKGSVVAAGSVVNRDVPPYSVVGGVPARKLKSRE